MSPQIASIIIVLLIIYLFWIDRKNDPGFSKAIWIPFLWIFFELSPKILEWLHLNPFGITGSSDTILEGNPLNRAIYAIFNLTGLWVLSRKKVDWHEWFVKNPWIWLYFVFGAISFSWSDYPFVSFKRWFKALGPLIMALLILTESRPYRAIEVVFKRIAFIVLPLSVLFIKYYPSLGREYHTVGTSMYTGVTFQKNSLGAICLMSGIFFSWDLFCLHRNKNETGYRLHYSIYLIIIPMLVWLFYIADSATSSACMVLAVCLFIIARHKIFIGEPRKIITFCVSIAIIFGLTELLFNIKDTIFEMLGRRADLTTRVPMWQELMGMARNPLVGFGYESFWLGERIASIQARWGNINQAHNGYLEMYLNLGIIGVFFIACWIVSGLRNVKRHLIIDHSEGMLRLCLIVVIAVYNYTEATFYGVSTIWMLFYVGVINPPEPIILQKQVR